MTKQEEIREGLVIKLASFEGRDYWRMAEVDKEYWLTQAHTSLEFLHSRGVVLKVDRDLPLPKWEEVKDTALSVDSDTWRKMLAMAWAMFELAKQAGFEAVEPLVIKEE